MTAPRFECRSGCGACCIAPSLSSATSLLPNGKAAGVPCPHLTGDFRCGIFDESERPAVCGSLKATREMCGATREEALAYLTDLEELTKPL